MTMFHAGRHRATRPTSTTTLRTGAGVLAATALTLGATTMTATSASANAGGPTGQSSTTSSSSSGFSGTVERGDRGDLVTQVQQQVDVTQDGVFGPVTEEAVRAWQRDNGLVVDGIVGPRTGSAMGLDGTGSGGGAASVEADADSSSVLGTAASLVGTPYAYGGDSPEEGFDCSGFTQYVFAQHGIELPRTTGDQQAATTPVSDPQPGDLVFFGSPAYHVGIYAGDGQMYDSGTSGSTVTKRDIWTDNVTYGRF